MLLKINLNSTKLIKATEKIIYIETDYREASIILTTHHAEGLPEMRRTRIHITHDGRIL